MYVGRAVPRAAAGLGAQPAGTSSQRAPETGGFVYCRNTGNTFNEKPPTFNYWPLRYPPPFPPPARAPRWLSQR